MAIDTFKKFPIGGGLDIYIGSYVQTAGAAALTFNLGSARVIGCLISSKDSSGNIDPVWGNVTESVSGGTNTVTVRGAAAVTSGYVVVFALAGQ